MCFKSDTVQSNVDSLKTFIPNSIHKTKWHFNQIMTYLKHFSLLFLELPLILLYQLKYISLHICVYMCETDNSKSLYQSDRSHMLSMLKFPLNGYSGILCLRHTKGMWAVPHCLLTPDVIMLSNWPSKNKGRAWNALPTIAVQSSPQPGDSETTPTENQMKSFPYFLQSNGSVNFPQERSVLPLGWLPMFWVWFVITWGTVKNFLRPQRASILQLS